MLPEAVITFEIGWNVENRGPDYQFLKNIPVFRESSEETLESILVHMKRKRFDKGQHFFFQGDAVDCLFFLDMGTVEIYKSDSNGRKLTLWFIENGDVFCLANMFSEQAFAGALALTDCLVYCIPKKTMFEVLSADQKLSLKFITCMSSKMAAYSSLVEDVTFRNVKERLAKLLLRFLSQDPHERSVCTLNQGELAGLLGTCREMVSRSLKKFREEGLIDMLPQGKSHLIYILDVERLNQVAQQDC